MTGGASEGAPGFDQLRARGIALAQAHSGAIWTDYNLHDPGVTLLEAFVFALTEYGYRAGFPVADLLTGADGRLDLGRLGLAPPREALASRPVTPEDLARAIAGCEPAIARILVSPRGDETTGLHDIHVIPATEADPGAALAAATRRFHGLRNLGETAARIALARCIPCRLEARIEIRRRHPPERVAALVYARCRRLMRDRSAGRIDPPATRADAFRDPAVMFGHAGDSAGGAAALDPFFADLIALEEIEDIVSLRFVRLDAPGEDPFAVIGTGTYREVVLPRSLAEVGLELVSRDLPVPFDLEGMGAELGRLRADHLARLGETLDARDWAAPGAGRRRDFTHVPVGHDLPPAYGAGPERMPSGAPARSRAEALQLRGYLAMADAMLADVAADLAALPDLLSADLSVRQSYRRTPLDFGPAPDLAAEPPEATRARLARFDPWHARKGRALDLLLALQGEEHSQNSLRQHDLYRSPADRRDAVLENRLRLLRHAAELNRDRMAGANILAGEAGRTAPICRKLRILLDFPDLLSGPLSGALSRSGLKLADDEEDEVRGTVPRDVLPLPEDPFETLVPRRDMPPETDRAGLIAQTDFLAGRRIAAEVLRRAIAPEAWLLAPEADGAWRLFLDPGPGARLLGVGRATEREAAIRHANRLRAFFTDLNRRSEGVHLVEGVLLRGVAGCARPAALSFVFSGWTARTHRPGFRRLAEETVGLVCPAHLAHRVIWLGHDEMAEFEALELDWRTALRDATRGDGPWAGDLERASARLGAFLDAAGAP